MNNKLFIGGLPWATTDADLEQAFSQAGNVVSARVMTDRMTGKSRGFGFVEMSSEQEAQAAIEMWNGKEMGGRVINVNIAKPMEERAPRQDGDRPRRGFDGGNRGGFGGNRGGYGGGDRGGFGGNRGGGRGFGGGGGRGRGGSGFRSGSR